VTTLMPSPSSARGTDSQPLLVVDNLTVRFPTADGLVQAVSELSYTVEQGQTLGIVGESGSGKSVSSMAVLGLHDANTARIAGSIKVDGEEVVGADLATLRRLRGNKVSMIFQDALAALHPFKRVGKQLGEAYLVHHSGATKREARQRSIQMLERVGIPQPDLRIDNFPHQFSGGMRQRAMIAMGLINDPALLIADEPTTALDVTVQAQILDLLQDLQREYNSGIILITHDLGVVAEMADDILVMYGGRAVEYGKTAEILVHPEMPYTWGLLSSVPDVHGDPTARMIPITGNPPSLLDPPTGCPFHPRCAHVHKVAGGLCSTVLPELAPGPRGTGHLKRCHLIDPETIYQSQVLPEIAPDLAEAGGEG
jgi:peptide/nickel transport system ATP-binding protein